MSAAGAFCRNPGVPGSSRPDQFLFTSLINAKTQPSMKQLLLAIFFTAVAASVAASVYRLTSASRRTQPLRISIVAHDGGYQAIITNVGTLPVLVGRCATVSDAMTKNTTVGDAVQRWNKQTNSWETIWKRNKCEVVPLAIVEARFHRSYLWAGQRLHTAAFFPNVGFQYSQFQHGDVARFLVFAHTPNDDSNGLASPQFTIE